MSQTALIWVHEDALGPQHPVFSGPGETARRVFVFDPDRIAAEGWGLNRLAFFYQGAQALGCVIEKGDAPALLRAHADALGVDALHLARTPDPAIREVAHDLSADFKILWADEAPLAHIPDETDLKRFSRYWRKAERSAFERTGSRLL